MTGTSIMGMDRARLFCLAALVFLVSAPGFAAAAGRTIVAFGDSTTAERAGQKVYTEMLQAQFPTDRIINVGLPNHTTEQARDVFIERVLDHRPNLVIIQFGINDAAVDVWRKKRPAKEPRVSLARYEENLTTFVTTLKARGIGVILMTPNKLCWTESTLKRFGKPPYQRTDPDGLNVILKDYAAVVRSVAKAEKVPLLDVYAAYEALNRKPGQSYTALLPDGVHPNEAGHRLVFDLLLPYVRLTTR